MTNIMGGTVAINYITIVQLCLSVSVLVRLFACLHQASQDDECVEESGLNFVALVQLLLKDQAERNSFFEVSHISLSHVHDCVSCIYLQIYTSDDQCCVFQAVYPVNFGVKFSTALKQLMWQFLSRLENALPQPTMEDVCKQNTILSPSFPPGSVMFY